ncbi:alpha/beta fold hydrolase [Neobacillus sp. Marseille-QA0830]
MAVVNVHGGNIHYEVIGNGDPILLLHGMGGTWKMWEPQLDFFSKHYQLILPDMRGHGESTTAFPENKFTLEAMAADLPELLEHLGVKKAHVIGVSMGGVIAQIFAYTHPEYVNSLILADAWCEFPDQYSKWVTGLTVLLAKVLPVSFINKATYSLYKGNAEDQVYTRQMMAKSIKFTKDSFIALKTMRFPNIKTYLKTISVPTLIAYGDRKSYGIDEEKGARTIFNEIQHAVMAGFHQGFDPVTIMRKDPFNQVAYNFIRGIELPELAGVRYEYK